MTRTGNWLSTGLICICAAAPTVLLSRPAIAAGQIKFTAKVDRPEISEDESVSLKLDVQSEGGGGSGDPTFTSPDFDVINEYTGTFVESYYDGNTGHFGMRNNYQVTKVLRPKRRGSLKIGGISVTVGGKTYTAPDIVVQVGGAAAGTPPPRGYGGGGVGLRGAGKPMSGASVKVRAEVDKSKVYKGEQVVVSYYLYRRVRVFNISVDKFPTPNGFLREDLEMPVLGQRLDTERVVIDGQAYERSLLLRYALYPLQEGKLQIDSTSLKYVYYPNVSSMDDEDPFMGFFRQMNPQQGQTASELLPIEVTPLPEEGKPNSFTGGVGDFNVTSAVDKYDVRANDAVTLTVKIEGRGNLAAIGEPKAKWPADLELYDSKGVAKSGPGGVGQKVFEFLLIPRAPGEVVLPAMELSFFDPSKKAYVTRTTEPITLHVSEPAPGSARISPKKPGASGSSADATNIGIKIEEIAGLMAPAEGSESKLSVWRWLYLLCAGLFAALLGMILFDLFRKTKARSDAAASAKAKAHSRSWTRLREEAGRAASGGAPWPEVVQAYELLAGLIFDAIDRPYGVGARSRPRSQLKGILVDEKGLPIETWDRISKILEYAEMVRFASSAGAISELTARNDLERWVTEGESVTRLLSSK